MIDILGHLFYISIFIGMLLLKQKSRAGWLFRLVGEIGWVILGFKLGLTSVWIWGIIFAVVDIAAFIKWNNIVCESD